MEGLQAPGDAPVPEPPMNEQPVVEVLGPGLLDVTVWRNSGSITIHLVNLTNAGTWRGPVDELIPVGPLTVRVKLPDTVRGRRLQLLVSRRSTKTSVKQGWAQFDLPAILDHEVAVIG